MRIENFLFRVSDIKYELRVFEKRITKDAFVHVREEIAQRWRNVQNEIFIALILKS